MAVCINKSWKVPLGYFFIDGLTGQERANLVRIAIERLSQVGAKIVSLTSDGPSSHFSMLSELGASLSITNIIPYFPHPTKSKENIQVILDICHMLKLVRNTLSQMDSLTNNNRKNILELCCSSSKIAKKRRLKFGNKVEKTTHKLV